MSIVLKNLISYRTHLNKISEKEVGGKALNLFRLLHYGFPVSPFYVVSSCVFDKVIRAQRRVINDKVYNIDFTSQSSIERASLQIKDLIFSTDFPMQFVQELFTTVVKMFGRRVLLSVRSSIVGEDSSDNSFAGQMDSFLNLGITEVAAAIRKVWASAFSPRAIVYRKEKHIELYNVTIAVILQEMVQSMSSGVMFTRSPERREFECVISAGFGLGEGVVTNKVRTDTYRIKWQADDISKEVQQKDFRIVREVSARSGNRKESLPDELQTEQVITDAQIYNLRDIGLRLEKRFKIPQDVEWAFDAKGRLFILQSRPIVFPANKGPFDSIRIWDNSNIIESYPGLTLPLTFTFV